MYRNNNHNNNKQQHNRKQGQRTIGNRQGNRQRQSITSTYRINNNCITAQVITRTRCGNKQTSGNNAANSNFTVTNNHHHHHQRQVKIACNVRSGNNIIRIGSVIPQRHQQSSTMAASTVIRHQPNTVSHQWSSSVPYSHNSPSPQHCNK
jgi:hypothetical protein